jgi:hypothetical protein
LWFGQSTKNLKNMTLISLWFIRVF